MAESQKMAMAGHQNKGGIDNARNDIQNIGINSD
jgi:hypothetical protein